MNAWMCFWEIVLMLDISGCSEACPYRDLRHNSLIAMTPAIHQFIILAVPQPWSLSYSLAVRCISLFHIELSLELSTCLCVFDILLTFVSLRLRMSVYTPACMPEGRNTPAQPLDIWSVWRDSGEAGNKYVWCVQLRRKLSMPRERCRIWLSMRSLRRWVVGRLSHWILWLVVRQLNGRSDGRCASESAGVWEGRNTVCALFFYALRSVIPRFHVLQYWHQTSCYVRSGRINLC